MVDLALAFIGVTVGVLLLTISFIILHDHLSRRRHQAKVDHLVFTLRKQDAECRVRPGGPGPAADDTDRAAP